MSELENIENVEEVETIPTDNTTNDLQENVEQSTEVIEVPEDNLAEIEAEQERLRQEHEEYLNSFPDTTVFYRDLLVNGNVKSLGMATKDPHVADYYKILDNHFDESELTYIGTPECGTYYLKGYEKPEPTLEELKAKKLAEISAEAHKYSQYECETMYLTSSVGYRINADHKSQDNIRGRINADHKSQDNIRGLIALGQPCAFKDFDNVFHADTSIEDLNTMLTECYANGASLYQQKFAYEVRVNAAKSAEDLNFEVTFSMADFSTK